ncbi:MAG: choice-of-anchor J domain-containing protein [Muribaculaceae bacterium]
MKKFFTLLMALPLAASVWGAETPPCKLTFLNQAEFDKWLPVDANKDGGDNQFKFKSSEQAAYYTQVKSYKYNADDWMISPAITLTAGKQYTISISYRTVNGYSSDKNDFVVNYGSEQTVESMTTEILNVTGVKKSDSYNDKTSEIFTVETSGDYCFGVHLVSEGYQGDFAIKSFTVAEFVELPEAISTATVTPAPLGEMKAELSWTYPSKNNTGGALSAISGVRIYREYLYKNFALDDEHLIATVTEGAAPGAIGTYTDNNLKDGSGTYYYAFVPFNENGVSLSDPSQFSAWIGEETDLKKVDNLKAVQDPDNEEHVLLTWNIPPQGANGAYVDPAKISYRIERGNDVLEESWTGELPYKDTTIPGAGTYEYVVKALYNGKESIYNSKVSITIKGAVALPYSNTFDNRNSVEQLTFVHAAPGRNDWGFSSQSIKVYESGTPNAFAYLPPFKLEAGKNYGVTFKTKVSSASSSKNLAVVLSTAATAEGGHTEVFREVVSDNTYTEKTAVFSVPADGKYYIGFLFDGDSNNWDDLYVDDVLVDVVIAAPAAVSDLAVAPGAEGALEATLTWTNPALTNSGSELSALTKVVVTRDGVEIKTFDAPAPGSAASFTDKELVAPGFYTYAVIPYLDENAGKAAEVTSTWVGKDTPKAPASVTVANDGAGRTVTFEAVTESANGGYMPAELTYTISRNGVVLAEGVAAEPYVDTEADLPLGFYTYSVYAGYDDVKGEAANSEPVRLGETLALPYTPDHMDSKEYELWTLDKGDSKQDWGHDAQWYKGMAIYGALNSWAYTPPFFAKQGECLLTFSAACQSTTAENLKVCLIREAEVEETPDESGKMRVAPEWTPEIVGDPVDYVINEPWSGTDFTVRTQTLKVPADGKYYVGFGANIGARAASGGRLVLKQSDIEQTTVTGVDDIVTDSTDAPVEYYNLQGLRITNPEPGLYIRVQGKKASKVLIK